MNWEKTFHGLIFAVGIIALCAFIYDRFIREYEPTSGNHYEVLVTDINNTSVLDTFYTEDHIQQVMTACLTEFCRAGRIISILTVKDLQSGEIVNYTFNY